jgi:hypothetical protein
LAATIKKVEATEKKLVDGKYGLNATLEEGKSPQHICQREIRARVFGAWLSGNIEIDDLRLVEGKQGNKVLVKHVLVHERVLAYLVDKF